MARPGPYMRSTLSGRGNLALEARQGRPWGSMLGDVRTLGRNRRCRNGPPWCRDNSVKPAGPWPAAYRDDAEHTPVPLLLRTKPKAWRNVTAANSC
jgi:hypothetical protein